MRFQPILNIIIQNFPEQHAPDPPTRPVNFFLGSTSSLPQTKNPIPHSHQKLNCLKSGVSYSSTVSLPINQEESTPLFRQLKFWCEYRTRQNPARLITEGLLVIQKAKFLHMNS